MESSRKFFPAIVVLLLLVVVATEVAQAQTRECETESKKFDGVCMSSDNCASVCQAEGFPGGGECQGFRRRCMCKQPC
ncbi:hypothetical protein ACP70R_009351 [Stipagrostis hirtigluma subsp. patula]